MYRFTIFSNNKFCKRVKMLIEKANDYFQRYEALKVLFFFDEDQDYKEEADNWDSNTIQLIIADSALFNLKIKLEYELLEKKIFLYFPYPEPKKKELLSFPLTDLIYANKILKIDDIAEFLELNNLKAYHRPLVKKYIPFIKTQKVQKVLAPILNNTSFEEPSIKKGLISSLLGFARIETETKAIAKILTFLLNDTDEELSQLIKKLEQIESNELVCRWLDEYLDVNTDKLSRDTLQTALKKLKYSLLMQNTVNLSPNDNYVSLKVTSLNKINLINALIQDWQSDPKLSTLINPLFSDIANDVREDEIVKIYGLDIDYGFYSEDLILSIIQKIIEFIPFQPEKSLSILSTLKSNATSSRDEIKDVIQLLIKSANIYKNLNGIKSYTLNNEEEYINLYASQLHRIDYYYRKFVVLADNIRPYLLYDKLELDLFNEVIHNKYEEHLKILNTEWLKCLNENKFNFNGLATEKQYNFYDKHINGSENKITVIISDALRYEAAYELLDKLHSDAQNQAEIGHMISSLPSNTKMGMANLLPHKNIEFNNGSFSLDGISSEGLENRIKILQSENEDSKAINFEDLTKLTRPVLREIFKASVVYVYHDRIDAIGDARKTESDAFENVDKAINELIPAIKKIHSSYNVTNVIVTADHGFLFNYKDLPDAMYETLPDSKSAIVNHNRFSIIDKEVQTSSYVLDLANCTKLNTDLKITIPKAINRYRRQGHGMHYVHGGASLQEMIIPVIESSRQRQDVVERVTFRLVSKQLKIVSGAIKVKLIQDKPIGSNLKPMSLLVGLYDYTNTLVSNESEVTLDSTASLPTERIFDVILNLKSEASKLNFVNLKAFDKEKEKDKLNPSINEKVVNQTLIQTDF